MSRITLNQCPFCGAENDPNDDEDSDILLLEEQEDYTYKVKCYYCGASGGSCNTMYAAELIWNTRNKND